MLWVVTACGARRARRRSAVTPIPVALAGRNVLKFHGSGAGMGVGWRPFFVCGVGNVSATRVQDRESWLRETLGGLGYELVDLETSRGGLLRIFIDSPGGITVEDCARVSNHLTRAFAVEGVEYERLEVSSPGLDRPLKRVEDYARFAGQKASVRLKLPRDGRRRFEGTLAGTDGGNVLLEVEGGQVSFALGDIDRARLVPDV